MIHLWVEGAFEMVAAAMTALLLIKLTDVERKIVEKWLDVELGLFLFTGIAGTGHFSFWRAASGVTGMSLAFGVAGVLQSCLERCQGQPCMVAQEPIRLGMAIAVVHGLMVLFGGGVTTRHLLTLRQAPAVTPSPS